MTSLNEFLLTPEACSFNNKKFIVPRFGAEHPIELKVITSSEYQNALNASIKWGKDHKNEGRDGNAFLEQICIMGIVDPVLTDSKSIEKANDAVTKFNAKCLKEVEDEYKEAMKQWEADGSDESKKPKKRTPFKKPIVNNAKDFLEFAFLPGEIAQIADTILEQSGFGITLEEAKDKAKN